jgi:hypothetical protein
MAENDFASELSRLDSALRRRQEDEARVLRDKSRRQERLNEAQRVVLGFFQSRARSVSVQTFRLIVETTQADLTDLSRPVQALFEPDEFNTLWRRIGYVQMSLASTAAPALRGFLGHIAGIVLEADAGCIVLVIPALEGALGSVEPLDGRHTRIDAADPAELRGLESRIDEALVVGLRLIVDRVEGEK